MSTRTGPRGAVQLVGDPRADFSALRDGACGSSGTPGRCMCVVRLDQRSGNSPRQLMTSIAPGTMTCGIPGAARGLEARRARRRRHRLSGDPSLPLSSSPGRPRTCRAESGPPSWRRHCHWRGTRRPRSPARSRKRPRRRCRRWSSRRTWSAQWLGGSLAWYW